MLSTTTCTMKRLLLVALGIIALSSAASAQQTLGLIDSVLIHTEQPYTVDRPFWRVFGFGFEYTDSIDYRLGSDRREREIPAMPPSTFFVLFDAQDQTAWIDRDVRGVPDSLATGSTRFALRYVMDIQRAQGEDVTIVVPRALRRGIDSINFRDLIGGTGGVIFNETITSGPDSVTIPNTALTKIGMIVYYDVDDLTSGIREIVAERETPRLRLAPNPARDRVTIDAALATGTRVVVTDMRGVTLLDERIAESTGHHQLALEELSDGLYFIRAIAPDGATVADNRLIVGR
jgi:hypothetical protein